jgi:hypothetical protein
MLIKFGLGTEDRQNMATYWELGDDGFKSITKKYDNFRRLIKMRHEEHLTWWLRNDNIGKMYSGNREPTTAQMNSILGDTAVLLLYSL